MHAVKGNLRGLCWRLNLGLINKLVGLLHSSYAPIEKMESPSRSMLPWKRVINSQAAGPAHPTRPGVAMGPLWRIGTRVKIPDSRWHLAGCALSGKVVFGTDGETGVRRCGATCGRTVLPGNTRVVLVVCRWGDRVPVRAAAPGVSVTISSVVLASSTLSCPPSPRTLAPRSPAPHTSPSAPHVNKYPSMPEPTDNTSGLPGRLHPHHDAIDLCTKT